MNDTASTEIYTLSRHDALPISHPPARAEDPDGDQRRVPGRLVEGGPIGCGGGHAVRLPDTATGTQQRARSSGGAHRSEEHTSELQSRQHLVCRLLLEKTQPDTA